MKIATSHLKVTQCNTGMVTFLEVFIKMLLFVFPIMVNYLQNVQARICYTGIKLGTKFINIKDLVKKSHQRDVVYYAACPKPVCAEDYTGETGRGLNERVIDHSHC